jgi:hypothetical protein
VIGCVVVITVALLIQTLAAPRKAEKA